MKKIVSAEQNQPSSTADFVTELTKYQGDLWAFLCALMPGSPDVGDVLQKTNLILWNKQSQFTPGSNFRAWAFQIARYEMLHHFRSVRHDAWVPIDETLADSICSEFEATLQDPHKRLTALETCLAKLRPQDRRLIEHRYRREGKLEDFARAVGRSVSALSVTLFRLRASLRNCVENQLELNRDQR